MAQAKDAFIVTDASQNDRYKVFHRTFVTENTDEKIGFVQSWTAHVPVAWLYFPEARSSFVATEAIQHIRRMRGGAQAHLMRCSDGHFYVVKFRNNPQHLRVLANEMFVSRLAHSVGLPVAEGEVVEVDEWLIEHTPELSIQLAHSTIKCQAGLQFGSRYVVNPLEGQVLDYLPVEVLGLVQNLATFAGVLALDKWTGNADGRQAAFWKRKRERMYTASFIDQGYCFNAGEWTFPDYPLRGVYARNEVYEGVSGWNSFEPWLSNVEQISEALVWGVAEIIPPEWYGDQWQELEILVIALLSRRSIVRRLIEDFRQSSRRPFPRWAIASWCVNRQEQPCVLRPFDRTALRW
jgi:hypothetical protein